MLSLLRIIRLVCVGSLLCSLVQAQDNCSQSKYFVEAAKEEVIRGTIFAQNTGLSQTGCTLSCMENKNCIGFLYENVLLSSKRKCSLVKKDDQFVVQKSRGSTYFQRIEKDENEKQENDGYRVCQRNCTTTKRVNCTVTGVIESADRWCELHSNITKENKYQKLYAVFGKGYKDTSYKWRCYREDSLTENKLYYETGSHYKTFHRELSKLIINHPIFQISQFQLGLPFQSCSSACRSKGRNCSTHGETLNSLWLFHFLGKPCDRSHNNWDIYGFDDQPFYDKKKNLCVGYLFVKSNSCEVKPADEHWFRLCRCI